MKRTGCCNFSIGRNAEHDRKDYFNFDNPTGERKFIAAINKTDKLTALAGETGIDIYERGKDKADKVFEKGDVIHSGDRLDEAGNDHPF